MVLLVRITYITTYFKNNRGLLNTAVVRVATLPPSRSGDGPAAGDAPSKASKGGKTGGKKKKTAENGEKKKSKVSSRVTIVYLVAILFISF